MDWTTQLDEINALSRERDNCTGKIIGSSQSILGPRLLVTLIFQAHYKKGHISCILLNIYSGYILNTFHSRQGINM